MSRDRYLCGHRLGPWVCGYVRTAQSAPPSDCPLRARPLLVAIAEGV
jgi:hypothetical protein